MVHDTHTTEHYHRRRSALAIFLVGLAGILLYSVVTLATIYFGEKDVVPNEAVRAKNRLEKRLKIQEEGAKKLSTYGWVDQDKGIVHIPIDQAMEQELPVLKQREVLNK
jgi:hypothetical protein